MGDLNQTVSLEIRGHLARRRLKRNDLAGVLDLSLRTVSDLLGERRPWRVDEIETVAAWLGISAADLLFPKHGNNHSIRQQKTRTTPAAVALSRGFERTKPQRETQDLAFGFTDEDRGPYSGPAQPR
jgi:hypothetical protein